MWVCSPDAAEGLGKNIMIAQTRKPGKCDWDGDGFVDMRTLDVAWPSSQVRVQVNKAPELGVEMNPNPGHLQGPGTIQAIHCLQD